MFELTPCNSKGHERWKALDVTQVRHVCKVSSVYPATVVHDPPAAPPDSQETVEMNALSS